MAMGLAPPESIHVLMARVLADLPAIGKDQFNQQQGFAFRGVDDVLNALNPILARHGVFYVPNVVERIYSQRATRSGSVMHTVDLHVRYRFYGPAGDHVEASGWGEGTDSGDKATNKAMTGAMKYVLFQVFAISTQEASDQDATTPPETVAAQHRPGPQDLGWPTPEAAKEAHAAVTRRVNALPPEVAERFKAWLKDNGIPWPATPDQIAVAEAELDVQEAYVEGERDAHAGEA
jgi:hypothetical protein